MNKARFHEYLNRSHFYRFAEWLVRDHTRILMKRAGFGPLKSGMFLVGPAVGGFLLVLVVFKALWRLDQQFFLVADGFFGFLAVG